MRRSHVLLSLVTLVMTSPLTTWWLVGDVSEDQLHPDYVVEPPPLPDAVEFAAGAAAFGVTVAAITAIVAGRRRGLGRPVDLRASIPLVVLGAYLGFFGRVATAGVGGANIGFGLLLMFGFVFVPACLAAATAGAWTGRRSAGRQH